MMKFFKLGARLRNDEDGATAIEYGLLAALIAVVLIAGATVLGNALNEKFDYIGTTVQDAGTGTGETTEPVTDPAAG